MNNLLFNNAMSFKKAGLRCLEEREIDNDSYEMLMTPVVVNLSFSLELYLKNVLLLKGVSFNRIHYLHKLFDLLDQDTKDQILKSYFIKSEYRYVDAKDKPYEMFLNWFEDTLNNHSNLFVKWRYSHETIENEALECDYGFLLKLIGMLEDLSNRLSTNE
ncbi:hypothetical protein [uncultured Psychroserpens sp.]|uniref:hypothetical protein n=1 Tax=uncultured Psychroserpens sp. TaxID=255436 RepID=UPI002639895E|nr:hypothetical protein [uncultured Psychroserpens sp.]